MLLETGLVAQTTHCAMGTVMSHKVFGPAAEQGLAAACREIARLEGLLSRFLPGSDISRVNGSAGAEPVKISTDAYEVLCEAVAFSRLCPGCFDVTIEPLVALWSRGKAALTAPDEDSIGRALALVDYRDLRLDAGDCYPFAMTAGLAYTGQAVDLGGIGKGYAGDRIVEVLRQFGVASAYSNLGGNVVTLGSKPDGSPWRVGIQHPRQENRLLGALSVVDQSVVTSGDYQRCFTDRQGKRHHHILNPTTGCPAEAGLISVTIVADRSLAADALSTSVFVAGMEKGLAFLRGFPRSEAVLVDADLRVYITPGLEGRFQAERGIEVILLD